MSLSLASMPTLPEPTLALEVGSLDAKIAALSKRVVARPTDCAGFEEVLFRPLICMHSFIHMYTCVFRNILQLLYN